MQAREKHTGIFAANQSFRLLIDWKSLALAFVFLFLFIQGFATEQNAQKVYASGNTTLIYSTGDNNRIVVTEGKITAFEGKAIRLLPGTHIKASEQLTVNIASKECQEAVAAEVVKEREEKMLAYAAERRREALLPITIEGNCLIFNYCQLPVQNTTVGQQKLQLTALVVNTPGSKSAPLHLLDKKFANFNIQNPEVKGSTSVYTPVSSWGELAGSIKVMRC